MASRPVFLPPARPSELLSYIISRESFPTTLIICSPKAEFLASLISDARPQQEQEDHERGQENAEQLDQQAAASPQQPPEAAQQLLQAPLSQVAIARHIRMVFIPTVSHLRAFLSVFAPADSKVPPPPAQTDVQGEASRPRGQSPLLLVYGFLELHRHTSEWSAQGLGHTAAGLVEAARLHSFQPVIVEPKTEGSLASDTVLGEQVPLLSGTTLRIGPDVEGGGWSGRTVEAKRVLGRWFRFEDRQWAKDQDKASNDVE
ncbi:uncharacterized protein E0L32_000523 [Thyridium curvatum]|uniref:Uncharacterized protein n=1 Tax=Thyridium curvatum TaxID=1093900 RepID=A0A507B9Q9_9PEZI|nr:uncharacterized protein E0L32_000523 [Thyridium curvatum]TPX14129.1 hypothetical protein E0L32_000523 [Thyridium curvatum]